MAITLVAGDVFGAFRGYYTIFPAGTLSPDVLGGFTVTGLVTEPSPNGFPSGSVVLTAAGDARGLDLATSDLLIDGTGYPVSSVSYDAGNNETTIVYSGFAAGFVVDQSYSIDIDVEDGGGSGGGDSAPSIVSVAKVLDTSDNASLYTSASDFTVEGGAGHLLVVFIQVWKNFNANVANSVVTVGGVTATNIVTTGTNPYAAGIVAVLENPTPGAKSIEVTVDGSGGRACIITCYEIEGCDGVGASAINQNAAVLITTTENNSLVLGGVSVRSDGICSFTPQSSVVEVIDTSTGAVSSSDINVMNGYMLPTAAGSKSFGATPSVSTLNINTYAIEVLPGESAPAARKAPRHSYWL